MTRSIQVNPPCVLLHSWLEAQGLLVSHSFTSTHWRPLPEKKSREWEGETRETRGHSRVRNFGIKRSMIQSTIHNMIHRHFHPPLTNVSIAANTGPVLASGGTATGRSRASAVASLCLLATEPTWMDLKVSGSAETYGTAIRMFTTKLISITPLWVSETVWSTTSTSTSAGTSTIVAATVSVRSSFRRTDTKGLIRAAMRTTDSSRRARENSARRSGDEVASG